KKSTGAELMDWADGIAYAVHDVDDFFRAGLIPLERLRWPGAERERFIAGAFARWESEVLFGPAANRTDLAAIGSEVLDGIAFTEPFFGSRRERALLRTTTASLIARYVGAITLSSLENPKLVDINLIRKMEIKVLKELAWFYVINRPGLATQQHGQ